jgi:hypothetical protein
MTLSKEAASSTPCTADIQTCEPAERRCEHRAVSQCMDNYRTVCLVVGLLDSYPSRQSPADPNRHPPLSKKSLRSNDGASNTRARVASFLRGKAAARKGNGTTFDQSASSGWQSSSAMRRGQCDGQQYSLVSLEVRPYREPTTYDASGWSVTWRRHLFFRSTRFAPHWRYGLRQSCAWSKFALMETISYGWWCWRLSGNWERCDVRAWLLTVPRIQSDPAGQSARLLMVPGAHRPRPTPLLQRPNAARQINRRETVDEPLCRRSRNSCLS